MDEELQIFNWRQISQVLTGGPEGVRASYEGKKHAQAVNELKDFAKTWVTKNKKTLPKK